MNTTIPTQEIASHWRSKFCTWLVYGRCVHARCQYRDQQCPKKANCEFRDQRLVRQLLDPNTEAANETE